jgi:glutathione synthase/RimK-type ligase-like ATP-grasp enzyme
MKIGIHQIKGSFSDRWIAYCNKQNIQWKPINCYSSTIIQDLADCDALMWPFYQNSPSDGLFAKQLIYSVEAAGKKVFPDFNTIWHFDDKIGQKYLLEAIDAPLVPTWIFYNKKEALDWVSNAYFPKVFKLRCGASSQNVKLVKSREHAIKIIHKAFKNGFPAYDPVSSILERWRLYRLSMTNFRDLLEGLARFIVPPPYAKVRGPERGYVYMQEFISGNDSDIRVVVIGDKAFAIKRLVRKGDFRASGSGTILYNKELISEETVKLAFTMSGKLKAQCAAYDFVYHGKNSLVTEISYGFSSVGYDPCPGYWDKELNWHEGKFNPYGWMVDDLIKSVENKA